ncbi:MAG: hypothetical protein HONBIEJF_01151 [Fimbriimonadaceae bacterium]|nr:hypothetical protein [Fimbriimonadaceae bacterium]
MLLHVISALVLAPPAVEAKVVGASLFKNGYAVILREVKVASPGEIFLDEPSRGVLGTYWITASKGTRIDRAVYGHRTETSSQTVGSILEFLKANIGKEFALSWGDKGVAGKLIAASDGLLVIESDGKRVAIHPGQVTMAVCTDTNATWTRNSESRKPVLRLQTSGSAGSVFMLSLEPGLTWAPAYAVDITDPKTLKLTAKATLVNDTVHLDNLEVKLITGFPNIPMLGVLDPFTAGQSVQDFMNALMQMGAPGSMPRGGGYAMQQNAARMAESFDEGFSIPQLPGMQAEDLFFYRLPGVKLAPGERGYFVLNHSDSAYEHLYEWTIPDNVRDDTYMRPEQLPPDNEVWHSLKFTNTSGQPMTTCSAITVKNGEILGQDMMKYVPAGAEATVKITKALDLQVDAAENETSRTRNVRDDSGYRYDEVRLSGTLVVRNLKAESVKLRIDKEVTGTVQTSTGNPKVTTITKGLRAVNPRQKLRWEVTVKPGEKAELKYNYTILLRV